MAYFREDACKLDDFVAEIDRGFDASVLNFADRVENAIPVYDIPALGGVWDGPQRADLLSEWGWVLGQGPGVLALKGAFGDTAPIDAATAIYDGVIAEEKAATGGGADHFAAAGANDRIWNSAQKLCLRDPETFALYFGNPAIAAVCEAWLGPAYQMTAQVNLVRPGGAAQQAHRDYHLGFQTPDIAATYPGHIHALSAGLTLQGAVAHCDMPLESGPTKLLPFSQRYEPGYVAWRRPDFRAYFEDHYVQLPLAKGDAVFFNPALFHAAGANVSADIQRMGNLLQISSAFGRAMETLDREAMCVALFPALKALVAQQRLGPVETAAAIAAAAEGYSFPTNLDTDPPTDGLAPETQAGLFHRAIAQGWEVDAFEAALAAQSARRTA